MAGMCAVLQSNGDSTARHEVIKLAEIPLGQFTKQAEVVKSNNRIYGANRKASLKEKRKELLKDKLN